MKHSTPINTLIILKCINLFLSFLIINNKNFYPSNSPNLNFNQCKVTNFKFHRQNPTNIDSCMDDFFNYFEFVKFIDDYFNNDLIFFLLFYELI